MPVLWQLTPPNADVPQITYVAASFAINGDTKDVDLKRGLVHNGDAIAQRIRGRILFFLGEWFLDRRLGVPWFTQILIRNADTVLVTSIFKRVVEETPGVRIVQYFTAAFDSPTRTLTTTFEAVLADGSTLLAVDVPFIFKDAA